ncbi:MAG: GGDEF domain-containing protein [Proteobacteria bacterium]|nr:GGDEF domain-containing protein [Pseudomonadota bacterium]MBU1709600.1 GGDEF domain-containing protein [Pseudomonadota bacterium]
MTDLNVDSLMGELHRYRQQSERLMRINELHSRLAGAVDLTAMIEAYSVWLTPALNHELIAYNDREKGHVHMFCSSHGPDRRLRMHEAQKALSCFSEIEDSACFTNNGFFVRTWQVEMNNSDGFLLLMRPDKEFAPEEAKMVDDSLDILSDSLFRAIGYEDLFIQARHDALTGLANRRVFEERLVPMLDNASRHGHPLSLASMDLDNFKQVNDALGHAKGDEALKAVARALSKKVRSSDLLVRMGGDEFMLALPDTEIQAAQLLANRLCETVENLNIQVPGGGKLGISIGLVQWNKDFSSEEWLQRTDEALYQAKAAGRSRVCLG